MKLKIHYYGDPILRAKARPIKEITEEVVELAHAMAETMVAHNGVGLAGPQVGKLLRIYVFRDEKLTIDGQYELGPFQIAINPVLFAPSKETEEMLEGCLSLPGLHIKVKRPKNIHIRYQNLQGEVIEEEAQGFLARVHMHENDHLNGVLHIDRVSPKERKSIESALHKIKQKYHS